MQYNIVTFHYKMLIDIFDLNKKRHDFCQPCHARLITHDSGMKTEMKTVKID